MRLWRTLSKLFASFGQKTPRVVLDTNVLISATLSEQGFSAAILRAARRRQIHLIVSPYILDEYAAVVRRPHIATKYKQIDEHVDALIRFLNVRATIVQVRAVAQVIAADSKDDAILACAVQGKADYIVSGDAHLQQLGSYRRIKILTPREFAATVLREETPTKLSDQ